MRGRQNKTIVRGIIGRMGPVVENYCFVDVTTELDLKIQAMSIYEGELRNFPHPRSEIALRAISAFRGASSGLKAAEAFMIARKICRS